MAVLIIGEGYGHGGDVYKNKIRLDFSVNINPLGTPEAVQTAAAEAARRIAAYPDPYCGALRQKLAEMLGVETRDILCANGAAELIFQFALALKPKKALLPVPSFSEYETALAAVGCVPDFYSLRRENGFALTDDILDKITPETELLLLCSPNNPTGLVVDWALLTKIFARCRETGTWLFLDECFLELADAGKDRSLIPELREGDRVFILRAFTKLYGMAGIRLGYSVCKNAAMNATLCRFVQPWNVSTPAQAAGEAALDCTDFVAETRGVISREKKFLLRELNALGISVLPGDANYLLLSGEPGLYEALLNREILIRNCANYRGLDSGDCRVAVRTHEENKALIAALREARHA